MEFDCITCGDHIHIEGEKIVRMVWKNGRRFWACSQTCAEKARDNSEI